MASSATSSITPKPSSNSNRAWNHREGPVHRDRPFSVARERRDTQTMLYALAGAEAERVILTL